MDSYIYESVLCDSDYEMVYESYNITLFKRVAWTLDSMGEQNTAEETPAVETSDDI